MPTDADADPDTDTDADPDTDAETEATADVYLFCACATVPHRQASPCDVHVEKEGEKKSVVIGERVGVSVLTAFQICCSALYFSLLLAIIVFYKMSRKPRPCMHETSTQKSM